MTAWTILDSEVTPVEGFDPARLPLEAARYVTARVQPRERDELAAVALEAGPYIGALPLTTGETLFIAPRVGRAMLARMLAATERVTSAVRREFETFASLGYGEDDTVSWLQLLARSFVAQLRVIEVNSLRPDRIAVVERRESAKGRLLVVPTLLGLRRGETAPVHSAFSAPTYDTAEHRVLSAAATFLLRTQVTDAAGTATARRWSARFASRPLDAADLRAVIRALNAGRYGGPRAYYIRALVMAQLILMQGGITLEAATALPTEALLINMRTLFESYVRITLRNALSERGYVVEKLDSGAPTLFTDGTAELKPDVIVSDRGGYLLLIDAKYKLDDAIEASDYYQMAAYLGGYRVRRGMIIRPRLGAGGTPIFRRMYDGGIVHEVNLGMRDADETERALIEAVTRVVAGPPAEP